MANLIQVFTTEKIRRSIRSSVTYSTVKETDARGLECTYRRSTVESAEFDGRLEVYIDLEKLFNDYADAAFNNKRRRFVRGPVEVRAIDLTEVPGTRKQVTK